MSQDNDRGPAAPAGGPAASAISPAASAVSPAASAVSPEASAVSPEAPVTGPAPAGRTAAAAPGSRSRWARPWVREVVVLAAFLAAGVAVTWPRAAYLTGRLPLGTDQEQYVWNFWWLAHQLTHLGNPWFTSYLAAPVGIQLGFDTLTPLLGAAMAPVTLVFGPSASYTLLSIAMPGLACYAMYRLARLWLPGLVGAIAAGAFFGLSGMFAFQAWYHLHTAAGCVFLPLTVEAAIRLRRGPTIWRGVILGVVVGASMLVDQEFAILTILIAVLLLIPWLVRHHRAVEIRAAAAGAVTAVVVASPQLIAMAQQVTSGGYHPPPSTNYVKFAAELPALFAPSTRVAHYGLTGLASIYRQHTTLESLATFGVVLTVLAVFGLIVSWRRRSAWLLGLLWLGSAVLALGPTLYVSGHQYVPLPQRWHGVQVSLLMPYTWFVRVPGLSSFREADRLAFLGLIGAALLAGAAVEWLRRHARLAIIAVVVVAALEAGWPGLPGQLTMPTAYPALDRPIAADHTGSVVVDIPFGIRGIPDYGKHISSMALVVATADGHPRAISYTSWTPKRTITGIKGHAFYAGLVAAQQGHRLTPGQLAAARQDLRALHVGWALVWHPLSAVAPKPGTRAANVVDYPAVYRYLKSTGFRYRYQADGVAVYRP
jgi:hypothetical protein